MRDTWTLPANGTCFYVGLDEQTVMIDHHLVVLSIVVDEHMAATMAATVVMVATAMAIVMASCWDCSWSSLQ